MGIRDIIKPPNLSNDRQWLFWQYSNRGRINGENEYYDMDVFYGNIIELKKLLSINTQNLNGSILKLDFMVLCIMESGSYIKLKAEHHKTTALNHLGVRKSIFDFV